MKDGDKWAFTHNAAVFHRWSGTDGVCPLQMDVLTSKATTAAGVFSVGATRRGLLPFPGAGAVSLSFDLDHASRRFSNAAMSWLATSSSLSNSSYLQSKQSNESTYWLETGST